MTRERHSKVTAGVTTLIVVLLVVFPLVVVVDLPPTSGVALVAAFGMFGLLCAVGTVLVMQVWREALS